MHCVEVINTIQFFPAASQLIISLVKAEEILSPSVMNPSSSNRYVENQVWKYI